MKRVAVVSLLCLAALIAAAQQTLPPLTEQMEVTVVNVDVTVLDASGKPVTGLTADDFELREDNVPQKITNFSAVAGSATKQAASSGFESDPERRRSIVVFIDNRSLFDKPRRTRAVAEIERLLATSPEDSDWSIVSLRLGRLNLLTALPLTSDRQAIHAALDAIRQGKGVSGAQAPPVRPPETPALPDCPAGGCSATSFRSGIDAAQQIESGASFFEAVVQTARGMTWLPGKKAMLIISGAVPGYIRPSAGERAMEEAILHDRMVREANAANVSLFVIDPNGPSQSVTAGAYWLANLTGGAFMPSNRLDESVARFDAATSHYYSVGYHSAAADGQFHRIRVDLKKRGRYTVMYRQNFLKLSHEQEFERTLSTPFGIASQKSTLPLTLTVDDPKPEADGKSVVPIRIGFPMASALFIRRSNGEVGRLHVYVSVFDSTGAAVDFHHYAETITNADSAKKTELIVSRALRLEKGTYRLFVTIRDELSNAVGVVAKEVRL